MTVGGLLRRIRQDRGMSASALGLRCGVSVQAIWNWEADRRTPSAVQLARVFSVLNPRPSDWDAFLRLGDEYRSAA